MIEGRIAVDASCSDLTAGTNYQSLKRLTVTSTDAYSTGKVALVTGTCTQDVVFLSVQPTAYKDSSGSVVSFSSVTRFAFSATAPAVCAEAGGAALVVSDNSRVCVSDMRLSGTNGFAVSAIGTTTASYLLLILGT